MKSRSVVAVAEALRINGKIRKAGKLLDGYYISARYPDAYPDFVAPHKFFDREQAEAALSLCRAVLKVAHKELMKGGMRD